MTRRRQLIALVLALFVGATAGTAALTLWPHLHSQASAQRAAAPVQVLAYSSEAAGASTAGKTDVLIHRYEAAARATPQSPRAFANLALAYMQKERETSDVSYYNFTEDAARTALKLDPNNYDALVAQGWVALGRHDFARAADLARQAIRIHGENAEDYANLGDAEANLGNYSAMVHAYQRMNDLKPSLAAYNRASYARWLYGDVRGATRFMVLAIRAGSTQPENVAWCETQLGDDYFNAGFVLGAQSEYRAALKLFPHYARALAGLGAVEAALGHYSAATRYYRQAIAIVPLPQFLASLGDLYASHGNAAAAKKQYAVIHFIDHIYTVNHVRYGIDEAQFDADHNQNLAQALQLARAESVQRHDIGTMDTLAWVLYKNGRYAEAWTAEQHALRLHTAFAPYLFHAGMIQVKLGKLVEAQSYLQSALMLNPNFSVLYAPIARAELLRLNHQATHPSRAGRP